MEENKKYTWETDRDAELWQHDTFDNVEDCVKDYLENYAEESLQETIFVGEVEPPHLHVDSSCVIETLGEQAYDECGEVAEDWYPCDGKNSEDLDELSGKLTDVVTDWLKKHNDMPTFYTIRNIQEIHI